MKIISIKVGCGGGGGGRGREGGRRRGWVGIYFNFTENNQLDKSNSDSNKSTDVSGLNFKELLLKHNLIIMGRNAPLKKQFTYKDITSWKHIILTPLNPTFI